MGFFLLVSIFARAHTLVISDIDDTIRASHSAAGFDHLIRLMDTRNSFAGASELYRQLQVERPGIQFMYISGGPQFLRSRYKAFLNNSGFPEGLLILKNNPLESSKNYKYREIMEQLSKIDGIEQVVLIGDNVQYDETIYKKVKIELAKRNIETHIFIHQVRSSKNVLSDQTPFFTPFVLALQLHDLGLVSHQGLGKIISFFDQELDGRSNEEILPDYMRQSQYLSQEIREALLNRVPEFLIEPARDVLDRLSKLKNTVHCRRVLHQPSDSY